MKAKCCSRKQVLFHLLQWLSGFSKVLTRCSVVLPRRNRCCKNNMNNILWFIDQSVGPLLRRRYTRYKNPWLVAQHEQICCMTSCEFDEKQATKPNFVGQSRPVLYFLQLSSTERFVLGQIDHAMRKVWDIDRKTCNKTMLHGKLRAFISCILPPLKVVPLFSKFSCSRLFHFVSLLDYTNSCSC